MREWFRKHWLVVMIGVVAFLPFSFTLFDPFISDDWDFLYSAKHQGFLLSEIFSTNNEGNYVGGSYRPMIPIFWRGLYQIFGLHPLGYHVATIAFHVSNALLLFFLVKRICKRLSYSSHIATIASILFAISPSRGEIAWISVVNDTLVLFFILLTLYYSLGFLEAKTKQKRYGFFILSLIFTFLAFLTKEVALIIPPTIFVLTFVFGAYTNKKLLSRLLYSAGVAFLYVCVVLVFFALRYRMIGLLFADYTGNIVLTPYHIIRALVSYVFGFFISGGLRTTASYFFIRHFGIFITLLVGTIGVCLYSIRRTKVFFASVILLGLFACSLVPIIRFGINVTPNYISEEGTRYLYVPSIFLSFFLALLLSAWYEWQTRVVKKSGMIFVLLCGLLLYIQLFVQTTHFHHATVVADRLLRQAATIMESGKYDGYVVVGLPDQYRGAPIFRNAFERALSLSLMDEKLPFTRLIVTRNRILYDQGNSEFLVSRMDDKTFLYTQAHDSHYVSSAPTFTSSDYTTHLIKYQKQSYALSVFDVGSGLSLKFSNEFMVTNQNKRIAVLFFTQKKWKVIPLFN